MKGLIWAAAAIVALLACATTAGASHVTCGQALTETTVLDSDVVCGPADPVGLRIGADDVTLWMNGFTIQAGENGGSAGIIDGGGNTASGNGTTDCVNVVCGPQQQLQPAVGERRPKSRER